MARAVYRKRPGRVLVDSSVALGEPPHTRALPGYPAVVFAFWAGHFGRAQLDPSGSCEYFLDGSLFVMVQLDYALLNPRAPSQFASHSALRLDSAVDLERRGFLRRLAIAPLDEEIRGTCGGAAAGRVGKRGWFIVDTSAAICGRRGLGDGTHFVQLLFCTGGQR